MERHSRRFDTMSKLCVQCRLKKRLFSQFRGQRIPSVSWQIWSERVALCGSRCTDPTMPCSVRAVFAKFQFCNFSRRSKILGLIKVSDLSIYYGLKGPLAYLAYTWHIPGISGSMALISDLRLPRDALLSVRCGQKSRQAQLLNLSEFDGIC